MVLLTVGAAGPVSAFETQARAAYAYDMTTHTQLMAKNPDTPLPPASMSKLMTLYMLFNALEDGRVSLDTRFSVSTNAKQMGGSTMFLDETDRPTVEQLIKGIIVQSGNDAAVVVAEGLAGTEDAFAEAMNERAEEIGLENSHFANASGWPDPGQRMSVKDLAILATRIIEEFPDYYDYFSLREFDFDGRAPKNRFNRDPLLGLGIGADGLKTGHTQKAGYGLVGSAKQGERRIVFVLSGLDSAAARREEGERVINWAFNHFVRKTVIPQGQALGATDVWMGESTSVDFVAAGPVDLLLPAGVADEVTAELSYERPVEAPIEAGERIAELVISVPGMKDRHIPLVAGSDVARGGFVPRLRTAAGVLFTRLTGGARDLY